MAVLINLNVLKYKCLALHVNWKFFNHDVNFTLKNVSAIPFFFSLIQKMCYDLLCASAEKIIKKHMLYYALRVQWILEMKSFSIGTNCEINI